MTNNGKKTLRELGIDGALAREMEWAMRMTGRRFTFRTPEGDVYDIDLGEEMTVPRAA
jgi:seryl-tRNA synthetase